MKLRSIFLPDNKKFFVLFDTVGAHLMEMSKVLPEAIRGSDSLDDYIRRLDELEKANDTVTHKLFIELGKNFITPFDREDIHFLATGLDDIADAMLDVVKQMRSHQIRNENGITLEIAEYNLKTTTLLTEALQGLRNLKAPHALTAKCTEIKGILTTGGNKLDHAVYALFHKDADAVTVLRKMDHFEKMQHLLNKTGNAVNVIESVVIKYG